MPLVHFDESVVPESRKTFITLLFTSLILAIVFYIVFLVGSIFEIISDPSRWIVLVIAIIHPLFVFPLLFFIYFKGY